MLLEKRAAGILLHPTSLPGDYGSGNMGAGYALIDKMHQCHLGLWQVLPLGPTGYGNSPYQTLSAFAGNPLLIDLDNLVEHHLINADTLQPLRALPQDNIDFGSLIPLHKKILAESSRAFMAQPDHPWQQPFQAFCHQEAAWLEDYALFAALKAHHGGRLWTEWEPALAARQPDALREMAQVLKTEIASVRFEQFVFMQQWQWLKKYANDHQVRIVGDIPIFVAHDSADVWANPELYHLDEKGNPTVVAGVPPDYFSETGQLWGNPLYRWDVLARDHYHWWTRRFRHMLKFVDIVRIDHFRGFQAYWQVPASEETAMNGEWVQGPGADFFNSLQAQLQNLPIIAEDLGLITPEVVALRDQFNLPGMRIMQFAFGPDKGSRYFLPHNHIANCIVYSGTHDNDTSIGWFTSNDNGHSTRSQETVDAERQRALAYFGTSGSEIHWDFIRAAFSSVAYMAIVPMQDILGLGSDARMNRPGDPDGNWEWRYNADQFTERDISRLAQLTDLFDRRSDD